MISRVIGTAGHIDHGKTTLVQALTGHNTDRLKEEQERKISIDLGFAPLTLPSGEKLALVDVPGHERFVKNMLAGVGGIDAVLFIVAADEGVMPQTTEHLEILNFLGIECGVIVLTKMDMVDEEMLELAKEDVIEAFSGTSLENAPIVPCSGVTGEGAAEVLAALEGVLAEAPPRTAHAWFRLPVDRVFSSRGFGTVVTGTVWSGTVRVGDRLHILPEGREVRVRKVEVFHAEVDEGQAGQRTALALHGVSREEVTRGDVLVTPGVLTPSHMVDARITLAANSKEVVNRKRIRFHHGASEVLGRIVLLEHDHLKPGEGGLVQFRLESPVTLKAEDRLIIRSYSPARTIAGGKIIDALPPKRRKGRQTDLDFLAVLESGSTDDAVRAVLRASHHAGMEPAALAARLQLTADAARERLKGMEREGKLHFIGSVVVLEESLAGLREEIRLRLEGAAGENPLSPGVPREDVRKGLSLQVDLSLFTKLVDSLAASDTLSVQGELLIHGAGGLPPELEEVAGGIDRLLTETRFAPPPIEKIGEAAGLRGKDLAKTLDMLVRFGKLVKVSSTLLYRSEEIGEIVTLVREKLMKDGEIDIGAFKEMTGLSRKYIVPLLEYLDRSGITRRDGDRRVPGPSAGIPEGEE